MAGTVAFGLNVVQFATMVSATVTAAAAVGTAATVRKGVSRLLSDVEENRVRSERNERLLLGGEAYPGVVEQVRDRPQPSRDDEGDA
jgi:hypothetical protein